MPKAEDNEELLESGQRHGLMEDERFISGQKRICFCYGQICGKFGRWWPVLGLTLLFPIVYIMGFYSGFQSNCVCNTTVAYTIV